jgi:hypothetical protein
MSGDFSGTSVTLDPAKRYTLAITAFENMPFAENWSTGNLGDGFGGLGNFDARADPFYFEIQLTVPDVPAPEVPEPSYLISVGVLSVLAALSRFEDSREPVMR